MVCFEGVVGDDEFCFIFVEVVVVGDVVVYDVVVY